VGGRISQVVEGKGQLWPAQLCDHRQHPIIKRSIYISHDPIPLFHMPISAKPPNAKFHKSRSKANAIGYEKRQARKANISAADVYEHIPEKTKRSNLKPDLDRDEARGFGESVDEASQEQQEALGARLVGEHVDDEEIGSEDDEEIESDDAFEESDEDRFADFFSSKVS
jgi:U3 small nucleolar RNA-associated protein 14